MITKAATPAREIQLGVRFGLSGSENVGVEKGFVKSQSRVQFVNFEVAWFDNKVSR